jgi:hypothetical protein
MGFLQKQGGSNIKILNQEITAAQLANIATGITLNIASGKYLFLGVYIQFKNGSTQYDFGGGSIQLQGISSNYQFAQSQTLFSGIEPLNYLESFRCDTKGAIPYVTTGELYELNIGTSVISGDQDATITVVYCNRN